jgi:hypothetical protein
MVLDERAAGEPQRATGRAPPPPLPPAAPAARSAPPTPIGLDPPSIHLPSSQLSSPPLPPNGTLPPSPSRFIELVDWDTDDEDGTFVPESEYPGMQELMSTDSLPLWSPDLAGAPTLPKSGNCSSVAPTREPATSSTTSDVPESPPPVKALAAGVSPPSPVVLL